MAEVIRLTTDTGSEPDRQGVRPRTMAPDENSPENSIGQELSRARQRSGRTPTDVSRKIKIPPHHLIAIEDGRFGDLPGRVYAVGYVRTYATYLGLDAEPLVTRLKTDMGPSAEDIAFAPPPAAGREDRVGEDGAGIGGKTFRIVAPADLSLFQALFGGLLIGLLVYSAISVFTSARYAELPPVTPVPRHLMEEAGLTSPEKVTPPIPRAERSISSPRELARAPRLQATAVDRPLTPNLIAFLPLSVIIAEPALTPPSTETVPAPRTQAKPAPKRIAPARPVAIADSRPPRFHEPLPLGRRYGPQAGKSRITLRLHRTTRVVVQGARNRILIDRTLAPGDIYRIPDETGLKLRAQDAGAVELILDDSTIGFAGRDGALARGLPLDPKSIARRARSD